jgi:hypothetical protein
MSSKSILLCKVRPSLDIYRRLRNDWPEKILAREPEVVLRPTKTTRRKNAPVFVHILAHSEVVEGLRRKLGKEFSFEPEQENQVWKRPN